MRVWLPDRPGALGLVASRIGAVDGDIVGIDVLERGDNVAVDEFAVLFRKSIALDLLVREIEEVDGASVEEVRTIDHFPDPRLDALESATTLCAADSVDALHAHARRADRSGEFLADWSALVRDGTVLASAGEATPDASVLEALVAGTAASPTRRRRHHRSRRPRGRVAPRPRRRVAHGARRSRVPAPRTGAARRARGHRRPHLGVAELERPG